MLVGLKRLKGVKLRLQKRNGHEMLTLLHTFGDVVLVKVKLHKDYLCIGLAQYVAICALQCGTGDDGVGSLTRLLGNPIT